MTDIKQKKVEAGRKGGQTTLTRHGLQHFAEIGRRGAKMLHKRYALEPVAQNDFALVNRKTGEIKAFLSGRKIFKP